MPFMLTAAKMNAMTKGMYVGMVEIIIGNTAVTPLEKRKLRVNRVSFYLQCGFGVIHQT